VKASHKKSIAAIDIGTSKVMVMVGEYDEHGFEVIGVGEEQSIGLRNGMVVDVDKTIETVRRAILAAENDAARKVDSVMTGIASKDVVSDNLKVQRQISKNEVSEEDVTAMDLAARTSVVLSNDQTLIDVIPTGYLLNHNQFVYKPIGMSARNMDGHYHVMTAPSAQMANISRCITRAGVKVEGTILQPIASSTACLSDDEKEMGVVLVDIGAGTTDIAIFKEHAVVHSSCIAIGGHSFTYDIRVALHTSNDDAEQIKQRFGVAHKSFAELDREFEVRGIGNVPVRKMRQTDLASIIQPRSEDLLEEVNKIIQATGLARELYSGVVLTGGASLLRGLDALANDIFAMRVRIALPNYQGKYAELVHNPRYATCFGLLQVAYTRRMQELRRASRPGNELLGLPARITQFFKNIF
jgi:cell division protein FtsA